MTEREEPPRPRAARRQAREREQAQARRRRRLGRLAVLGVLAMAGIALLGAQVIERLGQSEPAVNWSVASHSGGPRLAVDRLMVDDGAVDYGHTVQALFRLKNVGDQPLTLGTATVTTLAGC